MEIELVVFDIAGTTVKDNGNINEAFRNAFLNAGIEVSEAEVNLVMGYRKLEAIETIIQKYAQNLLPTNTVNTIHEDFTKAMVYFYENDTHLAPLPYTKEIFEWLKSKKIKIALDTGFTRVITNTILKKLRWDKSNLIDVVVCSDEVSEGRPAPQMIQAIMQQTGVTNAKKVVKVGDTEVDVNEGKNAGCLYTIAVTTGAFTKQQLLQYNPDFIIDSLQELPALLL